MKDCPSCAETVPESATLCRHCFHDFTEDNAPTRTGGPIFLLGSVALMALLAATTFGYVASQPLEERILVDQDTRSVVWTQKFRSGVTTRRVKWDNIAHLEYIIESNGDFEIAAITLTGDHHTIQSSVSPIKGEAQKYALLMDKTLEEVDNTRGFHKMAEE